MKKTTVLIILLTLVLISSGCRSINNDVSQKQMSQQVFTEELIKNNWQVDIMGVSGIIAFGNGTGTVTIDGQGEHNFDYTLSDISDDGKSAKLTITNSGIDQVDGQTVDIKFVEDGLEVKYWGMTYVLPPIPF